MAGLQNRVSVTARQRTRQSIPGARILPWASGLANRAVRELYFGTRRQAIINDVLALPDNDPIPWEA